LILGKKITMKQSSTISRKRFFQILGTSMAVFGLYGLVRLVNKQDEISGKNSFLRIKLPAPEGVTFYEDFYLVRTGQEIKAYSTTCTHAGCLISHENNGLLICPCHGSVYDAHNGKPLKGPAVKPLKRLVCLHDAKRNELIIQL
jgi:Rieske Fe-S protein